VAISRGTEMQSYRLNVLLLPVVIHKKVQAETARHCGYDVCVSACYSLKYVVTRYTSSPSVGQVAVSTLVSCLDEPETAENLMCVRICVYIKTKL